VERVTTGVPRRGQQVWVYGRKGQPCRRCGTPIRQAELGERVTYWCPSCQPD
jgi:endonuclease-8